MSDNIEGDRGNEYGGASSHSAKKHTRYTSDQVEVMEELFKVNAHPEEKERIELSTKLGLTPLQVKFWFQNRRTQVKVQQERTDNANLRQENERFGLDVLALKNAIKNLKCLKCRGPNLLQEMLINQARLTQENKLLIEENTRLQAVVNSCFGRAITSLEEYAAKELQSQVMSSSHHEVRSSVQVQNQLALPLPTFASVDESSALEAHAEKAAEEFRCIISADEPVWMKKPFVDGVTEILNANELCRSIPQEKLLSSNMKREGSKHMSIVSITGAELIKIFMDVNKWKDIFSLIVTKAETLKVVAQRNGLHLIQMYAELQVLSPLVPPRRISFLRLCQQPQQGLWIVVDFSLENLNQSGWYHKFPSGCVIRDMPDGSSQVTWMEQGEREDIVDEFKSERAFSAQHWLACLKRQCEWSKFLTNLGSQGAGTATQRNMIKLGQNLSSQFVANMSALSQSSNHHIKVTTRKASELGIQKDGIAVCVGTSIKLPVSPKDLFDFLRNERITSERHILLTGEWTELVRILNTPDNANCISFFEISNDGKQEFMLKQSCRDESGSFCAYACTSRDAIYSSDVSLIPTASSYFGFSVLPCHTRPVSNPRIPTSILHNAASSSYSGSSVLTIIFQEVESQIAHCNLSGEYVEKLHEITNTHIQKIKKVWGL